MIDPKLLVRVGAIELEATPKDPDRAFVIEPDGWSGWDDGTDVHRQDTKRPQGLGSFDAAGSRTSRLITAKGNATAATPRELVRMGELFRGVLADNQLGRVDVEDDGGAAWALVRLQSAKFRRWSMDGRAAAFQLQLWAPNPRKYGDENLSPAVGYGTQLRISHEGNMRAYPVIEIPGAPSAWSITSAAGTFSITGATPGGTHRLDMLTGRVSRDGVWMRGVGRGVLWGVDVGQTVFATLSTPGRSRIYDTSM